MPRNDCRTLDWYQLGYEDGLQGRVAKQVTEHSPACTGRDVVVGERRYAEGRQAGLARYCAPQNGFGLGLKGERYLGVCPAGSEAGFLRAYTGGKEIHTAEQQLRRLGRILDVNRSELRSLMESVRRKEDELLHGAGTSRQRAVLRADIQELRETVTMVESEISGIESAIETENRRLLSLMENARYR